MGMFDTVLVPCPQCGKKAEFQSKSGDCFLEYFELSEASYNIMRGVNRHSPEECVKCRTKFAVGIRDGRYTSMSQEEIEAGSKKLTNRDIMAAAMRAAIIGSVIDVATQFGMRNDFKPLAEVLAQDAVSKVYKVSVQEIDEKCGNYEEEIARLREEARKRLDKAMEDAKKLREDGLRASAPPDWRENGGPKTLGSPLDSTG